LYLSIFFRKCKEGPPRWPFALQAMQRVAIETPTPISTMNEGALFSRKVKKCEQVTLKIIYIKNYNKMGVKFATDFFCILSM
jgi:hypothetical protein